jgi:hypothetical protein
MHTRRTRLSSNLLVVTHDSSDWKIRSLTIVAFTVIGLMVAAAKAPIAPSSTGAAAPPPWLARAEHRFLQGFPTVKRPMHTYRFYGKKAITVVFEFRAVAVCGGCSAPSNADLPRGKMVRILFDRRSHKAVGPLEFCGADGNVPRREACLRH